MTSQEREKWRYKFAGEIYRSLVSVVDFTFTESVGIAIEQADALLAALEGSAPKEGNAVYKIGHCYRTLDGHIAKVLGRKSNGTLIVQVGDHVVYPESDGKIRPTMICNYLSDGPCAYDLTPEEV